MTIKLYMNPVSPPARSVQMTAKALGVNMELKVIDLLKGDHKTPVFLKINPQHTIPVIDDNGTIIWDSHAINAYLVSKYGKNDSLYPKDPVKRAIVDQRLHFDSGVLFAVILRILRPIFYHNKSTVEQELIDTLLEAYEFLEKFLESRKWIAGDTVTIADYNIYNSIAMINIVVPVSPSKFPKITAWYKKVDTLPESEVTKEGLKLAKESINKILGK